MIDFQPITPEKRQEYFPILYGSKRIGCEDSFVNLYVWLSQYGGAARVGSFVCARYLDGYLFPTGEGDLAAVVQALREDAEKRGAALRLYGVTEDERRDLERVAPNGFDYEEDRDAFDYVYPIDQLADLPGRKLQAKRNHCNRFEARYNYEILPLTKADAEEISAFCEAWYAQRPEEDYTSEKRAIALALAHFDQLGLCGIRLTVEGKTVAFAIGSPLTEDTFDVHYEKADTAFDGAYSMVNRAFAGWIRERYPTVTRLNREDDMGLEGLRKAKLSYQPQLLVKYIATEKCEKIGNFGKIRDITEEDIGKVMVLCHECFEDTPEDMFPFFQKVFPASKGYCFEENGEIKGLVFTVPCEISNKSRVFRCLYIYALCTGVQDRGQGIAGRLLEHIRKGAQQQGMDALLALPEEPSLFDYYEKFGYRTWAWASGCSFGAKEGGGVSEVDAETYLKMRKTYLEKQEMAYMTPCKEVASLSRCFGWEGGCCAADLTGGAWFIHELCGSAAGVPEVATILGEKRLTVMRSGGGYPYVMALAFCKEFPEDGLWAFGME